MSEKIRDSGIAMEDDESQKSSSTATSSSVCDCNGDFSYVQRLRKRFECLAREKFHTECNWWLDEVDEDKEHETVATKINEATNTFIGKRQDSETELTTTPTVVINRQYSRESEASTKSRHSDKPQRRPEIILSDYHENNETNDTDSFESASEEESENDADDEIEDEKLPREVSRAPSISSQHSNFSHSKLFNILSELFENEKNYVRTLELGIENYMKALDRDELPKQLRGQKFHIFANIESIYNFHKNEFLPALLACDEEEPIQVAETFTHFLTKDYFYSYIIYAINRKRSELLCNCSMDFWREIQNECGDRLGINSFLLQPIQRLPRYKLLLNEIFKDLSKDLGNTKQSIAAFCVAEKNIQRLLDTVNESMSINDVKNCFEIDILCQGKFKRVNEFDIFDWETRRRFQGKVFLFENSIIYTEALNREFMEYRGNFDISEVGIIHKEGKNKFKLFVKRRGNKEVEFRSSMSTVMDWNETITGMLMKFVAEEKQRNESRRKSSIFLTPSSDATDSYRSSVISNKSDLSYFSVGSAYRSSSSSSGREQEQQQSDIRQSKWYI